MSFPNKAGIYKIIEDEEIIYIGSSENVKRRLRQHIITARDTVDVKTEMIKNASTRKQREKELIKKYSPELNREEYLKEKQDVDNFDENSIKELEENTRLAKKEAKVYILTEKLGYTVQEAADEMNIGYGTASNKRNRIRQKIREAEKTAELSV